MKKRRRKRKPKKKTITFDGSNRVLKWKPENAVIDIYKFFGEGTKDDIEEPIICSTFACGRTLNIHEKLFGDKCIVHNHKNVSPMTSAIMFKEKDEKINSLEKENDALKKVKAHLMNKFAETKFDENRCREFLNKVIDSPHAGKELVRQVREFVSTLK